MPKEKKPVALGDRVKFTRRNGKAARGSVAKVDTSGKRGTWFYVDAGIDGLVKVRESELTRY